MPPASKFVPLFFNIESKGKMGRNPNVCLRSGMTEKPPRSCGVGRKGSLCVSGGHGAHPANTV